MEVIRIMRGNPMPHPEIQPARSNTVTSLGSEAPSSPTSSDWDKKSGIFFQSIKDKARRSLSRDSLPLAMTPKDSSIAGPQVRKKSVALEILSRRSSGYSDDRGSVSRASTSLSSHSSTSVNWKAQRVEGFSALEADTQLLRTKRPYLVVTSEYLVKVKSHSDAISLFPQLEPDHLSMRTSGAGPEPLLVIPIGSIVSVFAAENTRCHFAFEVWWRVHDTAAFRHALFCFPHPMQREEQMHRILNAVRLNDDELGDNSRYPGPVAEPIRKLFAAEEPNYQHYNLEIYPVIPRGPTRRDSVPKSEDKSTKSPEGHSFYLAIGANLCFYVEAWKGNNKPGEVVIKHSSFGLVTLQRLKANWTPHEEKFEVTFRKPFKAPVTLELASRYYRQVIRVFGKADRYLKPAWPQTLQNREIFQVSGLKEPQYLVSRGNYGSIHRTLDAYTAAYRCRSVDWEINWRSQFAPEFRLLPPQDGGRYSPIQLLSVLRALRYNDYFRSLSFRDVDLSALFNFFDRSTGTSGVAYLNRSCVALGTDEIDALRFHDVLHNEFHALAFCAETVRQIDFTNSFRTLPIHAAQSTTAPISVQFLAPILNLLETGSTRCNHLILSGNALGPVDIRNLVDSLKGGHLQGLDISRCGLSDMDLRDLFEAAAHTSHPVQMLNISGNLGRIPARMVPNSIDRFLELRELNLYGSILGDVQGPLFPVGVLDRMMHLRELDISHCKINTDTLLDLEAYLLRRSWNLNGGQGVASDLRRLVLNNCGLTGRDAAKLFNAIGEDHGLHLFLSGNPLEEGIEHLAQAIQHSKGPTGLHMDMVEFRDESNYALLIEALTTTKHLSLLSLVGTGPIPSPNLVCGEETLVALENFFAQNTSISYLDMSGYSGRLDECQLAKGFGHALQGLAVNKTLTHVCIRNQNLHDDAGTLGNILRQNQNLRVFDCQDNGFNLTSLQFLVQALKENRSIIDFPLSLAEKDRIWMRVLGDLQRSWDREQNPKAVKNSMSNPAGALRQVLERSLASLQEYLDRNQSAKEELDSSEMCHSQVLLDEAAEENWPMEPRVTGRGAIPEETTVGTRRRRGTLRSTAIAINTSVAAPYRVRPEEGMESPTDALGSASAASVTPPEPEIPGTPEDIIFQTALQNLKESGFESL